MAIFTDKGDGIDDRGERVLFGKDNDTGQDVYIWIRPVPGYVVRQLNNQDYTFELLRSLAASTAAVDAESGEQKSDEVQPGNDSDAAPAVPDFNVHRDDRERASEVRAELIEAVEADRPALVSRLVTDLDVITRQTGIGAHRPPIGAGRVPVVQHRVQHEFRQTLFLFDHEFDPRPVIRRDVDRGAAHDVIGGRLNGLIANHLWHPLAVAPAARSRCNLRPATRRV